MTRRVSLVVCLVCLAANQAHAEKHDVRYAQVDPKTVRLEVVDGSDIRFARLSVASVPTRRRGCAQSQ
jgi:hypothetical protein